MKNNDDQKKIHFNNFRLGIFKYNTFLITPFDKTESSIKCQRVGYDLDNIIHRQLYVSFMLGKVDNFSFVNHVRCNWGRNILNIVWYGVL